MSAIKAIIILVVALVVWPPLKAKFFSNLAFSSGNSSAALAEIAQNGIRGHYVMEGETGGQPRLSLLFIDKQKVQMLGDGKPWGKNNGICTYQVSGDKFDLTHACGIWHMEIKGEVLHQSNYGWQFRLHP